jgi:hypothetical protein
MSKLYFGICPYGTICDVFINTLAGWSNKWLQPCTPDITNTGHLIHRIHEQYVIDLTNNNPMSFRNINWNDRLGDIEVLLKRSESRNVWIGNFDPKQAQVVKDYFGDDVTTIGISYTASIKKLILENVVCYDRLSTIEDRQEYLIQYNTKYYTDKHKWDSLVPANFKPKTDISIDIVDFFNPDIYLSFIESVDGKRNLQQLEYYFTWLARTKERLNENF